MEDEHGNETGVNQRQCRASGEGNDSQRNECDGDGSIQQLVMPSSETSTLAYSNVAPLEAPVVAAVGRVRRGSGRSVVHATPDDLRKRRENVSGSAGLESGSWD